MGNLKLNSKIKFLMTNKIELISLVIMAIVLVLVRLWFVPTYYLMIIIGINIYLLFKKVINELEFILYTMIMPSEFYSFIGLGIGVSILIYKIIRKKIDFDLDKKNDKILIVLIGFMLISGIINSIINKTILSSLMSLGYIFIMLFLFKITKSINYSSKDMLRLMDKIFIIQVITIIFQYIDYGIIQAADAYSGTFSNAHRLCVWLIFYMILIIIELYQKRNNSLKMTITKIILILILIYLSDGKHIILAALVGMFFWGIFNLFKKTTNKKILLSGISIFIMIYLGTNMANNVNFKRYLESQSNYLYRYVYIDPYNNKFDYFNKTVNNKKIILGYGPGFYGSRMANLRAHEYMAKEDGLAISLSKIIKPYIVSDYKQFASKYNEEYLSKVKDMSAVLSYPFSSIISLIAELGVIGYILWLLFFNSVEKYSKNKLYSLFPIILLVLMIFDSYFEMTAIISFFWVIMGVSQVEKKEIKLNY